MDIWAWVIETEETLREAGHDRLADLIDEIPSAVCDDDHERVDLLVPEAIALSRELRLPWVELFLRHWHLQSLVLHRLEVRDAQREAVALLDFAHRDETRGCPQAVCAVQDFAACHGLVDGPGYAAERMQVCKETLARVGPRWPCFACISGELADAMIDGGDAQGALAMVHAQRAAMQAAGVRLRDQLVANETIALLELGRPAEALATIEHARRLGAPDDHTRAARALLRAQALSRLGRPEEALEALPPLDVVRATGSHWLRYAIVVEELVSAGAAPNDAALGATLTEMLDGHAEQGVLHGAVRVGAIAARLALARGATEEASTAVAKLEAIVPAMRAPERAERDIAELRARIESAAGR